MKTEIKKNTMACHAYVAIKTDEQIIRKMVRIRDISPVDGGKVSGRKEGYVEQLSF